RPLIEPVGSLRGMNSMRAQSNCLHYLTNRARLDQFARPYGRTNFEALAETNRVDTSGFSLDMARFGGLLQRCESRFIAHEILIVLHHLNAQRRTFVRNARADNELNALVLDNFPDSACETRLRKCLREFRDQFRFRRVDRYKLCASA